VDIVPDLPDSSQPAPQCPRWCLAHIPSDPLAVHHIGIDRRVQFTGGGPNENGWAHVSIERFDDPDFPSTPTEVHLDTRGGPMKPMEALQLSEALQQAALGALGLDVEDWEETERWALEYVAQPAADADGRRFQAIVADLLAQAEAEA
jgi:hypothetical protein